ncbi:hypothetical protein L7F22_057543 [Adiantum nelumboides]|nr:hypothetical protein [Adiantum nelumboides]
MTEEVDCDDVSNKKRGRPCMTMEQQNLREKKKPKKLMEGSITMSVGSILDVQLLPHINEFLEKEMIAGMRAVEWRAHEISSKISKWVLELQEYYTFIVKDSTRASLADVLIYKVKEKKITPKAQGKIDLSPQDELKDAYTLLFDGAYRRQRNKAAGGFVILNEEKKEVLKKGIQLHLAHSNNEAEYATLKAGLEECKSMGIRRLMVKGDALLIVKQVQGTWACKNSKLLQWLDEVKLLMKDFEAIQIQHISRQHKKEADNMANTQFEVMVGAIKFKEPLFQGQETMEDILYFLETALVLNSYVVFARVAKLVVKAQVQIVQVAMEEESVSQNVAGTETQDIQLLEGATMDRDFWFETAGLIQVQVCLWLVSGQGLISVTG